MAGGFIPEPWAASAGIRILSHHAMIRINVEALFPCVAMS
jgi:hypothetical protein